MDKRVVGLIVFVLLVIVGLAIYLKPVSGETEEQITEQKVEPITEEPNVVGRVQELEQKQAHTEELMQKIIDMGDIDFPYCSFDDLCQSEKVLYECNLNDGFGCNSVIDLE